MSLERTRKDRAALAACPVLNAPKTKQEFAKEADANVIMARAKRTGLVPMVQPGSFADVSEVGDFREMLDAVTQAQASFMALDPKIRARFHNDPAELLDFVADVENRDEAIKLGLIAKPLPADGGAPKGPQAVPPGAAGEPPKGVSEPPK